MIATNGAWPYSVRMRTILIALCGLTLSGCALMQKNAPGQTTETAVGAEGAAMRPQARPEGAALDAVRPPQAARTVEQFDTTTPEQRAAAAAPAPAAAGPIGTTVASLGDPAKPGFWLETPLVKTAQKGRVSYGANGKSAQVDLIPIKGPNSAGSRISLAAMRLLDAPLTGLPELQVFAE